MKRFFTILLFLLSIFSIAGEIETRECLEQWHLRNIGLREQGENRGAFIEHVLRKCNLDVGNAYCGCYIYAGYLDCGVDKSTLPFAPAWSPAWNLKDKTIYLQGRNGSLQWQTGDVFALFSERMGRVFHVGNVLYSFPERGYVITAEGNVADLGNQWNPGEGVHSRKRSKKQIYAVMDYLTPPDVCECIPAYHTVNKKETLYRISIKYGISLNDIGKWNPQIKNNVIHLGEKIKINEC